MKIESNNIRVLIKKCEIFLRESGYSEACISAHQRKWEQGIQQYMDDNSISDSSADIGEQYLRIATKNNAPSTIRTKTRNIHIISDFLSSGAIQSRNNQRTEMFLKLSKLRYNAVLEEIHCTPGRNLSKEQLQSLSDCSFIERAENILITGAAGCGKSYLACAIGRQACRMGYKTMYIGMNRFLEKIAIAKLDGSYLKLLNQIEKTPLVILDDFGLYPLDNTVKLTLLQLLEDRYGRRATIITSQFRWASGMNISMSLLSLMRLWTDCQVLHIKLNSKVNLLERKNLTKNNYICSALSSRKVTHFTPES